MVWPRSCSVGCRSRGHWDIADIGRSLPVCHAIFLRLNADLINSSSSDSALRKNYVSLVEGVRDKNAEVLIFSSMHESGQREFTCLIHTPYSLPYPAELNQLTGIAAILTFPLDVEVVEMEERQAKEEEEQQEAGG